MTDDLKRFIESFEDEDALRRAIEALLMKMPECMSIHATHGALERGKDIIFYSKGLIGGPVLNACVIKNTKISGSADSNAGAMAVFHQAQQSLDNPVVNAQGEMQAVSHAYIMTPHECSPHAMDSIKGSLQKRSGQVTFVCGNDLLFMFKKHWPEFLLANVKFLGAHVKSLRDELDGDRSVARLLIKEGFSAAYRRSLASLFVQPRLALTLRSHELKVTLPEPKDFERPMREQESGRLANILKNHARLISSMKTADGDEADVAAQGLNEFGDMLHEAWVSGYNEYRARPDVSEKDRAKPRETISIILSRSRSLGEQVAALLDQCSPILARLRKHLVNSNELASTKSADGLPLIRSENLSDFYFVSEISQRMPSAIVAAHSSRKFEFTKDLLDRTTLPLLITGPAGYGKTSFCRWNALRDLEALERQSSNVLPVYIQLHKLGDKPLRSFQDAFLASDELATIWRELTGDGSRSEWTLRLYLDGLDEVPNASRQVEIASIAASGVSEKVQIIMTARNHVGGPWLSWLRRLDVQTFNDQEVRQLAEKWLDGDASKLSAFEKKLERASSLGALMKVPLLATLILAVYKHGHEGLPESKPRLYEMFVQLHAGGWDAAKDVRRSRFQSTTKIAVLSQLAAMLHDEKRRDCTTTDVHFALRERVPGLEDKREQVVSELIADGLLVPMGSMLSFPHLSFQEFLTAKDLLGLVSDRANLKLDCFLTGDDWWREVLVFYVGFSDKPSEMEDWVRSGMLRALPKKAGDLVRSKAIDLLKVIRTKFPSFKFSKDTLKLLREFSEPASKPSPAKKVPTTRPRIVSG